ncbi:MAG: hypothetical protein H0W39_09160 [Sphingomonas sp.]|nr:hypothetical protein [Sphingomonas sp.]
MSEPDESPSPVASEAGRKSLYQRFSSPEWAERAAVLAGVLGLVAAIIAVVKS